MNEIIFTILILIFFKIGNKKRIKKKSKKKQDTFNYKMLIEFFGKMNSKYLILKHIHKINKKTFFKKK